MRGPAGTEFALVRPTSTSVVAGLRVAVSGRGPAVLFVHGFPTSGRLWSGIVARLGERHTCIVVDLPGCGDAPARPDRPLDPVQLAASLDAVRADLGLPSWAVVGHDAGSVVGVHYAAAFPERVDALVLMAAPLFGDFAPPPVLRWLRTPLLGDAVAPVLVPALLRHLPRLLHRGDAAARAAVASFAVPFRGLAGARRFVRLARWGDPRTVLGRSAALLGTLDAPTLVVHGAYDSAIHLGFAERAAAAIPGARLDVLGCGHFAPLDRPAVLARTLRAFFAGRGARRTAARAA